MRAATKQDSLQMAILLRDNGLPDVGIDTWFANFSVAVDQNGSLVGLAGFELYGESCLLRSVAVDKRFRGRGHGQTLVKAALENARIKGVKTAYLLTENADQYFKKLGFEVVNREVIDEDVKRSPEFTELCDETAIAMCKLIG
jgi:amino-acid N-acetyltransferase